jgi:hypothetical protein
MRQQDFQATPQALARPKNSLPYPEQGVLFVEAEISLEKNVQISAIHDPPPKQTAGCAIG